MAMTGTAVSRRSRGLSVDSAGRPRRKPGSSGRLTRAGRLPLGRGAPSPSATRSPRAPSSASFASPPRLIGPRSNKP